MTTPTQGEHAQTAAQVQRYKIGYPTDSWGERSSTPSGIPDHAGAWVRYEDHAAQVAALTATPAQPAAPQCVAYAELDDAFESWLEDQDVDRLSDGYESWLNSVRSCWDSALRASHGQAPAGAADEMEINRPFEDPAPPFNQWRGEMQSALKRAGVYAARSPGAGNKLTLRWRTTREDVLPTPTAQAAPAAGAVTGPAEPTQEMIAAILRLVDLEQSDPEDHRYDDGSKLATQICRAVLAAAAQAAPVHELDAVIAECEHGLPFDATSLATLKRVRDTLAAARAPAECGNCFEGKSDFDHVCKHCGGSGKVADSMLEDAADPLQGAANWLAEAHGQFSPVVLSGCLMIGYNRAKRLHDAARKQGGA